ncbi:hypothetical protein DMN91_004460 [Ooceraea biroi]|uniref:DUF3668 domain-containing protein n=1 Tax=Ooceraea biroi TaxID=2015173 RepID=A0A3L8DWD3_OOCBI|nr:hypothetical protein DMN91_004460 [Ooceraea biroi]
MIEAAESSVQIVLSIKEGKGFEQVLQPTLLLGTLNGHSLQTDRIDANPTPQYETDLVWETNKTTLRKMRSGQVPLKLECFAFKENGGKERLGYVLLSIRSAHVTSKHGDSSPRASWHKLLGLRNDFKTQKPQLLLTLKIEDRKNMDSNPTAEVKELTTDSDVISQTDKIIIPYLYPNEQLIQLGPLNTCCELFLLSITAIHVENLHLLLPEHLNKDGAVRFSYRILENDVELKSFKIESGESHLLHEKVVIRIRSSLQILEHYLQSNPCMSVFLKHESNVIAESSVNLQSLVPVDTLQGFLKCTPYASTTLHEKCFLSKRDSLETLDTDSAHKRSYLDVQLKLQYIGNKTDVHNPDVIISSNDRAIPICQCNEENINNRRPEIEYHRNPAGDFERFSSRNISSEAKCETQQIADRQCPKYQSDKITHSYPCDAIFCNCVNRNYPKGVTSYHCFCLNISLAAITLVSDRLSGRQIEFRFHHPKAEITSTTRVTMPVSSERAKLHDIGCQFHFISAPDEIKQLLQSFPPKISMHDTNENAKSLSLLMLDMKPLFYQDKPECQYKLPMYDTDGNKIGEIDVILKLENHGPHFVLKKEITGKNLGPPILDDSLAYKIVDELETWKDRQKEIFKVELKKKEERYLNMLSEEWRKQKENLESKLACSVEQCKMLANSLNNATEDLRTRRLKSLENESRLIKANEDVQWRYEVKLQELKDSLHAMQSELTSKVTKLEEKKAALETQMELLLYENENLKMSMNKQTQELQMYQKASLTQDQTASLLQEIKVLEEKLDNAQKGKSFFKERWGKAVREIHRMKLDNQCAMQVQIKNSKEELKNVDLAEMLSMDTKALNNDQMLLHELQKEIDIIKPSASKETYNEIFMPSERYNERLQALKEERDSLLRTGSYAADDVVIKRLNTEIQSLLISR